MLPFLEATPSNDSGELTTTDGWLLRVAILLYGSYCLISIIIGFRSRSKNWAEVMKLMMTTYRSFTILALGATSAVTIYMLRPVFTSENMSVYNPKELWYMIVGIGHVFYGLSQANISFQRIPRVLLSKSQAKFVKFLPYILASSLLSRVLINCIVIGLRVNNADPMWLRILSLVL